jgi:triphosphoribosyl-dephospho-CoA synthetase
MEHMREEWAERRTKECSDETCRQVAEAAVRRVFAILGVDVDKPESVEDFRADLRFGKGMRRATDHGILIFIAAIFSGIAYSIWTGIKALASGHNDL